MKGIAFRTVRYQIITKVKFEFTGHFIFGLVKKILLATNVAVLRLTGNSPLNRKVFISDAKFLFDISLYSAIQRIISPSQLKIL